MNGIVAEFHKAASGRLCLFSLTTVRDGRRSGYDVEWSRCCGYIWHQSSSGGARTVEVSGIYFLSGDIQVTETPTQLVDADDKPPWTGSGTFVIRQRNRTRRLKRLPKFFSLRDGEDLIEWMENNAIHDDPVWCSRCRDWFPEQERCEHIWWCEKTGGYSTPDERCPCKDQEECCE